ncbi:MAG: GNAT family N-acetyltransferase [Erysipelotrichaceae bacterium]|nr:GNAT family N-acetyltransferase [Erysipelotrichaceae bacterium]
MIETKDLLLDKAKLSDHEKMYENVWRHPEAARYMFWKISEEESDALPRMERTIAFQKDHDTYLIYEKKSGEPIGFAGMERIDETTVREEGICLGPAFVARGYGRQVLQALIDRGKEVYHAENFIYSCRKENIASRKLAESFGFTKTGEEEKEDPRDGSSYTMLHFTKKI